MAEKKIAVVLTSEGIGTGDPALRRKLAANFLHALESERILPAVICLYTEGVRLALEDSPVLANLRVLEGLGTRILICRTCLDFYGVSERVAVGEISNMGAIVTALAAADSVLTP